MGDLFLSTQTSKEQKLLKRAHSYASIETAPKVNLPFQCLLPCNWLWNLDTSRESTPRADEISVNFTELVNTNPPIVDIVYPTTKFKGIVPQLNGKWGAQIYEKNQRIWLGTFNTEEEAAQVYDRAVLKYRGGLAVSNFNKATKEHANRVEEAFLKRHTKQEVVDMLRRHTYEDELQAYSQRTILDMAKFNDNQKESEGYGLQGMIDVQDADSTASQNYLDSFPTSIIEHGEHLFDKSLTPSDVGKLNRLVIPKHHAERFFPLDKSSNNKGLMLTLQDSSGKMWRFRYSYWASSQSFVFTKGWSAFVKEKKLRAGSIVSFKRSLASDIYHKRCLFIICKPFPVRQPLQDPALGVSAPCSKAPGSRDQRNMSMKQVHADDRSICANNEPEMQLLEQPIGWAPCTKTASGASTSKSSTSNMHQVHAHDISMNTYTGNNQPHKRQKIAHDVPISTKDHTSIESHTHLSACNGKQSWDISSSITDDDDMSMHGVHTCGSKPHLNQQEAVGASIYIKPPIFLDLLVQRNLDECDDHDHVHSNQMECSTEQCHHVEEYFGTTKHTDSTASSSSRSFSRGGLRLFGVDMEPQMITSVVQKAWLKKTIATVCDASESSSAT